MALPTLLPFDPISIFRCSGLTLATSPFQAFDARLTGQKPTKQGPSRQDSLGRNGSSRRRRFMVPDSIEARMQAHVPEDGNLPQETWCDL